MKIPENNKFFSLRVLAVLSFSTYPPIEKQLENLTKGFTYRFLCNNILQYSSCKYIWCDKLYNTVKLASAAVVFTNKTLVLLGFFHKINISLKNWSLREKIKNLSSLQDLILLFY
jgi:hypothetical protein